MGLEALTAMEYPGRFIILGRSVDDFYDFAVYGITGRSPSSHARRLVLIDESDTKVCDLLEIRVEPTDLGLVNEGNKDLLIYPAMIVTSEGRIGVSNGKQTYDLSQELDSCFGEEAFFDGLSNWSYEPDGPHFTPRIQGILDHNFHESEYESTAGLGIIKKIEEKVMRNYFEVPLIPGKGWLMSTYSGKNQNPLPSFQGEPFMVDLPWNTPGEAVAGVYDALSPEYRVSVASVYRQVTKPREIQQAIKNRHEI